MRRYLKLVALTALISIPFLGTSPSLEQQVFSEQQTVSVAISPPKQAQVLTVSPLKPVSTLSTQPVSTYTPVVSITSASSDSLMAAAGISASDYYYVSFIVSHEGGWGGVETYNAAGSGAYGLCQALPGSKMASAGADWATNPVTQLEWCNSYALSRYGSWYGAYEYWLANGNW